MTLTPRGAAVDALANVNSLPKKNLPASEKSHVNIGSGIHSVGGSVRASLAIARGEKELAAQHAASPEGQREIWNRSVIEETARVQRIADANRIKRQNEAAELQRVAEARAIARQRDVEFRDNQCSTIFHNEAVRDPINR